MMSGNVRRTHDTISFLTWNINPEVISLTIDGETEVGARLVMIVER